MVEFLPQDRLLVGCERAADLRQHLRRRDRACLPVGVGHQVFKALTLVGVGDGAPQGPPQPLDAVGVRVLGRGVDQPRSSPSSASSPRSSREPLGVWMPRLSKTTMAILPRCRERATARRSWAHRGTARRPSARAKSRWPSRQSTSPKPYCLALVPGAWTRRWPALPLRDQTRVRVGCGATSTSSCSYRSARSSRPSRRGRSSGNKSSARVASGTRQAAGGGSGDAAAPGSASTLRRFCPPRLGLRLARQDPAGPLAQVPGPVQRDPDGLDPRPVPGHVQVVGQQPTAPQRTVHTNLVGIQVGHPDQLGLPGGRVVGRLAQMGPVRHGVGTVAQVAPEHPPHRVGAAPGQVRDLDHGVALGAQQDHLVAGAGGGVAGGLVAAFQLGLGGLAQGHAQRRSHDRPPCDQET
jgi:hypothetical protein